MLTKSIILILRCIFGPKLFSQQLAVIFFISPKNELLGILLCLCKERFNQCSQMFWNTSNYQTVPFEVRIRT